MGSEAGPVGAVARASIETLTTPIPAALASTAAVADLSRGLLLMLSAVMCFAFLDASAKWLIEAAQPALQVAVLRYAGHFLLVLCLHGPRQGCALFRANRPFGQLLRGSFLLGATCFNFMALVHLPLTITQAIFFAAPMVVCLLSMPVLGEQVGLRRFVAVLIGFAGVLVIIQPGGSGFHPAMLFSIAATLCASGYFLMTRFLRGADSNAVSQCYTSGLAIVLLAPWVIGGWVWPEGWLQWLLVLLIGSLGYVGHSLLVRAHDYAEASVLAPTVYSQIVYAALLSWWLFDSPPDARTLVGAAIIVASGLYIWMCERRQAQAASLPADPLA